MTSKLKGKNMEDIKKLAPNYALGALLNASLAEQREWIKGQNMSVLEELKKNLTTLIKEINAVEENIISEDEIETFFDSVSEEEALRNIAVSNASINENDREWARQILREREA